MKDYLLLFRGGPQYLPAQEDRTQEPISPNWRAWMEGLAKNGHLPQGKRLVGGTGAVLKGRKPHLTDGPFAEGKEIVAGYLVIKANNLEEAISLLKGCPLHDHEDGSTEIREIAS